MANYGGSVCFHRTKFYYEKSHHFYLSGFVIEWAPSINETKDANYQKYRCQKMIPSVERVKSTERIWHQSLLTHILYNSSIKNAGFKLYLFT